MTTATLDDVLTLKQLAERWGLKIGTLRNWRRAGKGPVSIPLGSGPRARRVYRVADVLAYEEQQKEIA